MIPDAEQVKQEWHEAQAEPEVRYRREASMPVSLYSVYVLITVFVN